MRCCIASSTTSRLKDQHNSAPDFHSPLRHSGTHGSEPAASSLVDVPYEVINDSHHQWRTGLALVARKPARSSSWRHSK